MVPSDRFKPIQKIVSQKERNAAIKLGESLKQREMAQQRLDELREYLSEYLQRFAEAARNGLSSTQAIEYQAFIGKLEAAIDQQQLNLRASEEQCDASKASWRGRYTKSKAMETAVERLRDAERRDQDRKDQSETDDRSQRRR